MKGLAAIAAVLLSMAPVYAGELAALERVYGRSPLTSVIGWGGLTAGFDEHGRVAVLRWPGPGGNDQLGYEADESPSGIQWGLLRDGTVHWPGDDEWMVTQTVSPGRAVAARFSNASLGVEALQRAAVHPETDRLSVEVRFTGLRPEDRVVWFADLNPTTRKLPELPIADTALDGLNDFACFVDGERGAVVHFRPSQPGRREWTLAEIKVDEEAPASDWYKFGEGVWLGYRCNPEARYRCLSGADALLDAEGAMALGDTRSIAIQEPELQGESHVASLTLYAAESSDELRDLLDRETPPETFDSKQHEDSLGRLLETIRVHQDRETGAVVRSAASRPPLHRDWPSLGAWTIRALDLAGESERAREHIDFYLSAVRGIRRYGEPEGSMPFALYTDGIPATLRSLVDTPGAAFVLWAIAGHTERMDAETFEDFLRPRWKRIARLTDFLVAWADDRNGVPRHSFDPLLGRDRRDRGQVVTGHMALSAVMELAQRAGKDTPESWSRRKRQWDVLLRSYRLAPGFEIGAGEAFPFAAKDIYPPEDTRVAGAIQARLEGMPTMPPETAARVLAELALYYEDDPAQLASLRPHLDRLLGRMLGGNPDSSAGLTDSYAAATAYVAGHLIRGSERAQP